MHTVLRPTDVHVPDDNRVLVGNGTVHGLHGEHGQPQLAVVVGRRVRGPCGRLGSDVAEAFDRCRDVFDAHTRRWRHVEKLDAWPEESAVQLSRQLDHHNATDAQPHGVLSKVPSTAHHEALRAWLVDWR